MRILFLCHSFNSLTQRLYCELVERGHEVSVEFDIHDDITREAVTLWQPDLIIAPFLKRAIPADICRAYRCLVVHPGPPGDGGPSALDWAILNGEKKWAVTVLEATEDLDGGPVWASRSFPMRRASKASLYRHEVTEGAVQAVLETIDSFNAGLKPIPVQAMAGVKPVWRSSAKQADRAIDWQRDPTEDVLRKIASADGMPGLRDRVFGQDVFLFNASRAKGLDDAAPGTPIARSGTSVALATTDGAVWIGHVKRVEEGAVKLPATYVFADETAALPERPGNDDIRYKSEAGVGFLRFSFYNGAMGTEACERLRAAFLNAAETPEKVIVLCGGADHWSNGLDLNLIEAADSPADESWRNINAMNDLSESIIQASEKLVISAVGGNAGAGGVFLARAADEVWISPRAVLNPHYKDMGNLYGSEFWTYLLPRYAGEKSAKTIQNARLPMGAREAVSLSLADRLIDDPGMSFSESVRARAIRLAACGELDQRIADKRAAREADEAAKPLAEYRNAELSNMRRNFYGFDPSYHVARYNFVHKVAKSRTPLTIARHRVKAAGPKPRSIAS